MRERYYILFADSADLYMFFQEPKSVRIIEKNVRITLESYVDNRSTVNFMNILANQVTGVFSVQNNS